MGSEKPDIDLIFLAAIELAGEKRAAYLDEVCGEDADLRARVERLLQAPSNTSDFLESPAAELEATADDAVTEQPGAQIGPYKLLQQIGEGGFGVVYMAEQTKPVRRRVALKIIKPGMDTREVVARFEAERQALAMMDHPNIARVLDAGSTESGRAYFVMELVKGEQITDYCDHNQLSISERLQLFVAVCQAIQHAHQKGIIHRDIKPSNVLVCLYDGQPIPKVIDFGIAKAIQQPLVQRTLFTQFGQIIGTLEYMSPEQAELNQLDVDTRSDIYSLGVLLYELLTGTTPLTRERLREAALAEMLRMIREADPERPSARLSHSGEALPRISAQRKSDPEQLHRLLAGELDWIVVKSLEKDRLRRYATAADFARDVQRHLNDEAVEACPPSLRYRLGKFTRRNRVALTTAAVFALMLTVGAAFSTWQAVRAWRAEQQAVLGQKEAIAARQLAQKERDRAIQAEVAAVAQKEKAVEAEGVAKQERDKANIARAREAAARQAAEADRNAKTEALHRAEGLRLTAQSSAVLSSNPGRALLLAIEGAQRGPRRAVHNNALLAALSACREERTLPHSAEVYLAAVTPDGRHLLCCSRYWAGPPINTEDHQVRVWDLETGQESTVLAGHHLQIASIDISPDSRKVVFAYKDQKRELRFQSGAVRVYTNRVARLWDLSSAKEIAILRGHKERVVSAEFSPDGRRILTTSYDGVRVWNAETGKELVAISNRDSSLLRAGFLDQGRRVFTAPSGARKSTDYGEITPQEHKMVDPAAGVMPPGIQPTDLSHGSSSGGGSSHVYVGMQHLFVLWDSDSGEQISQIDLPPASSPQQQLYNELQWLAVSPDGERLFTSGVVSDPAFVKRRAAIWQVETGQLIATLQVTDWIHRARFSPDGNRLLTVMPDHEVILWNAATGQEQLRLTGHQAAVLSARFSSDGQQIVTASEDKTVRIWDTEGGQIVTVLRGHEGPVSWADFTSDGRRVVSASSDGTARTWRLSPDRECSLPLVGHSAAVNSIHFHPDGKRVVTASDDKSARIWDVATGQCLNELTADASRLQSLPAVEQDQIFGGIRHAEFDPRGHSLLTLADDRIVHLLNTQSDSQPASTERKEVVYTPARLWDAESGELRQALEGSENNLRWAVFSPDGSRVLTAESQNQNVRTYAFHDGRLVSRGGSSGGSSHQQTFVRIYDTSSGRELFALPHTGTVNSAVISPDGTRVLTANQQPQTNPYATLWDADTGRPLRQLGQQHTNTGWSVFSPKGRHILTMDLFAVSLWDAETGEQRTKIEGATDFFRVSTERAIPSSPFSPDGRRLALPVKSSPAGTLAIWDVETGEQHALLAGHRGFVYSAEFSPDGKMIVTAGADETARIWDAETGAELYTLSGHEQAVRWASFSPDGGQVATASADGTGRLWLVDPLPAALARKPRELTDEERARYEIGL